MRERICFENVTTLNINRLLSVEKKRLFSKPQNAKKKMQIGVNQAPGVNEGLNS